MVHSHSHSHFYDPNGVNAGPTSFLSSPLAASPVLTTPLSPVPEPSTLALLVAGLVVGVGVWRKRKGLGIGEAEVGWGERSEPH